MKTWRGARADTGRVERLRSRPWTDPRLLLGVLLVLGATVLGARVAASADDSVRYWALATDVRSGDPVAQAHLEPVDARLSSAVADRYLRVDDELPAALDSLQWAHDAGAGALVTSADLVERATAASRQLPVSVAEGSAPEDLARGDRVDVWVGAAPGDQDPTPARRVLGEVTVLRTGGGQGALEGGGTRSVLLQVEPSALQGAVVSAVASGHVTLVRVP